MGIERGWRLHQYLPALTPSAFSTQWLAGIKVALSFWNVCLHIHVYATFYSSPFEFENDRYIWIFLVSTEVYKHHSIVQHQDIEKDGRKKIWLIAVIKKFDSLQWVSSGPGSSPDGPYQKKLIFFRHSVSSKFLTAFNKTCASPKFIPPFQPKVGID